MIRIITILFTLLWSPVYHQDSISNIVLPSLIQRYNNNVNRNDNSSQISSFNEMGDFYLSRRMYEEACNSFSMAYSLISVTTEKLSDQTLFDTYTGYSQSLLYLNRYEKVRTLLDKAMSLDILPAEKDEVTDLYSDYYIKIGDFKRAEMYYERSSPLQKMRYQRAKHNYASALKYGDSLLVGGYPKELAYLEISEVYKSYGDYKNANIFLRKSLSISDSLNLVETIEDLKDISRQNNIEEMEFQNAMNTLQVNTQRVLVLKIVGYTLVLLLLGSIIFLFIKIRLSKKLLVSQKELNKALIKIQEESRTKTDFLKNLSKDIREPLTEIVSLSDGLSKLVQDDIDYERYSRIIHESSDQLVKLVNDSIDISNYDLSTKCEYSYINSIVRDAVQYLEIPLRKEVSIVYDIPHDYQEVYIQRGKVVKILSNLIHNAAKFTLKGYITIKCRIEKNIITFTVTDTGCGIPVSKQEFVFDYFTKLDYMSQGLGLGLPLSKLLAESMDGKIFIDSTYHKGCQVILSFPIENKSKK